MNTLKILLIEDNKIVVMGIQKVYKKHIPDAKIIVAENGMEALELLSKIEGNKNIPCFIILDINMPILNGIEFLEIIKKDDQLSKIPIVVHTTSSNIEDYNTCIALGISGYYVKDINYSIYKKNLITIADYWNNSFRIKL
jgi:CheY-like chemotaxis protein